LSERAGARFATLSAGQRQRLALALALVNEPELIALDEPTAGLDPHARRDLHQVVRALKREGRTVLLTTHHIDEAEALCDRVAIVDSGRIVALGSPAELVAAAKLPTRIAFASTRPLDPAALRALPDVAAVEDGVLATSRVHATVAGLVRAVEAAGGELTALTVRAPSLEDAFLVLTGKRIGGEA
jgi:ABC-2 type transport system ATP-binding protein